MRLRSFEERELKSNRYASDTARKEQQLDELSRQLHLDFEQRPREKRERADWIFNELNGTISYRFVAADRERTIDQSDCEQHAF